MAHITAATATAIAANIAKRAPSTDYNIRLDRDTLKDVQQGPLAYWRAMVDDGARYTDDIDAETVVDDLDLDLDDIAEYGESFRFETWMIPSEVRDTITLAEFRIGLNKALIAEFRQVWEQAVQDAIRDVIGTAPIAGGDHPLTYADSLEIVDTDEEPGFTFIDDGTEEDED